MKKLYNISRRELSHKINLKKIKKNKTFHKVVSERLLRMDKTYSNLLNNRGTLEEFIIEYAKYVRDSKMALAKNINEAKNSEWINSAAYAVEEYDEYLNCVKKLFGLDPKCNYEDIINNKSTIEEELRKHKANFWNTIDEYSAMWEV